MQNINDHIRKNQNILGDALISSQQKRHIEGELDALIVYRDRHPEDDHDPTQLEIFCDENPESPECKIFDV